MLEYCLVLAIGGLIGLGWYGNFIEGWQRFTLALAKLDTMY